MSTDDARSARAAAASRWRPDRVRFLLVAEAPPSSPDRYFYFETVPTHDALFRHVATVILGSPGERQEKTQRLVALRDAGVFLIDLCPSPIRRGDRLEKHVPDLVDRCRALQPDQIILIKATVHDVAFKPLRDAGLPVLPHRIPFPGSGQQRRFLEQFTAAWQITHGQPGIG